MNDGMLLDAQIDRWRAWVLRRQKEGSAEQLEAELRGSVEALTGSGLSAGEALLVALRRVGERDAVTAAFAREHAKELIGVGPQANDVRPSRREGVVAFCLAVAAACAIKLPELFGISIVHNEEFYGRNLSFFVLPLLAGYFAWKRKLAPAAVAAIAIAFGAGVAVVNGYPFAGHAHTESLTALHLPIALWLCVGVAYCGVHWRESAGRMDFVRFSGELFIYYVLIALGGGVFVAFMTMIFEAIGIRLEPLFATWIFPCGAAGAVLVASWLVETKRSVMENMAPVLARVFTPLFTVLLLAFLGTVAWTGRAGSIGRSELIGFDLLLAVVAGLHLYSVSSRDPERPAGAFDVLQVILVVAALLTDAVALFAIVTRLNASGLTPNRVAALGENLVLLVSLGGSAVLAIRHLAGRGSFAAVERWQTAYLPVYSAWAALVVIAFPPLFRFL